MTAALKRKLLIFLILSGAAVALVAASLPRLTLKPGIPPPFLVNGEFTLGAGADKAPIQYEVSDLLITVALTLIGAWVLWMLYKAIQGARWKELSRDLIRFIVSFLVLLGALAFAISLMPKNELPVVEELAPQLPPPAVVTAPLGAPPPLLTWIVGALLAVSAALLAAWSLRARKSPALALERLGEEAEKARQALLTGMSLREVILQCYQQMSSVLQEENGIERQAYMTTGEFERLLAREGFPAEPVHQLTRLFDAVRYGRWQPGLSDDQRAIACLDAIVQYSKDRGNKADGRPKAEKESQRQAGNHA